MKQSHKAQNRHVRDCTSNSLGFCWVDDYGSFFFWPYQEGLEPEVLFRLWATFPPHRYRLTARTSPDGTCHAICATNADNTGGLVHCYSKDYIGEKLFTNSLAVGFATRNNRTAVVLLRIGGPGPDYVSTGFLKICLQLTSNSLISFKALSCCLHSRRKFRERYMEHLHEDICAPSHENTPRNISLPRFKLSCHGLLIAYRTFPGVV